LVFFFQAAVLATILANTAILAIAAILAISGHQENQGPTVQQSFLKEVVLNYFYSRIRTDCLWPCYVKFFNLPTTLSLTAGSL
jgi:hypothetical protein